MQKANAKSRGIDWEFTFQTWIETWGTNIDNRGGGKEQLCMCRKLDNGPYSPGNVYIDTNSANSHDRKLSNRYKGNPATAPKRQPFGVVTEDISYCSVMMARDPMRAMITREWQIEQGQDRD